MPDATESMHQHFIIIMQSVTASVKQSSVATNNLIVNPEGNDSWDSQVSPASGTGREWAAPRTGTAEHEASPS